MHVILKSIQSDRLVFALIGLSPGERIVLLRRPRQVNAEPDDTPLPEVIGEVLADSSVLELTVPFGHPNAPDLRELLFAHVRNEDDIDYVAPDLTQFQASSRVLLTGPSFQMADRLESMAALTIAYNDDEMLERWVAHYGAVLGNRHLFVIDDGSQRDPREFLPLDVNIIRQPRTSFDSWRLCRSLSSMQRFLLETYDLVLVLDADEFLLTDDERYSDFAAQLRATYPWGQPILRPQGWELLHALDHEPPLHADRPILEQRSRLLRAKIFDKPCITAAEISLFPGNHNCFEDSTHEPSLQLIHMRWFDLSFALAKGLKYTTTQWAELDLAVGLSDHQRLTVSEIEAKMREYANQFDQHCQDPSIARRMPDHWRAQLRL